ncbi:uncharacterized protein LOC107885741 [Acyrthosiphon pisum]|uniref:Uncharacterized protein n=1 Tax=Acyrthosiphon pisum TaxID=7029 RepID=A0A8R2D852_ACYPI|nr:uncharacterized protein LOC107885741 [Acyrthosiphon pisum]|eukprot:XP_016664910.1 PREDICTED: uncharacterized protein LOC107885741 [Acyrthosiphon pisum]
MASERVYKYIAPASPGELIDCTNYTIDFVNRKFLQVGIDPTQEFNVCVRIITPSRFVNISVDFLKRLYSLMGHILSHILDTTVKYRRFIFLENEFVLLTSMIYRGECMLVIESKVEQGCRILLSPKELMAIQNMEWTIFETVTGKTMIVRPMILLQLDQITEYFKNYYKIEKEATLEEFVTIIKGIQIELISKHVPKNKYSFINQIKLLATEQLAGSWMEKLNKSLKGVEENYGPEDFFSPPFTQLSRPCKQPKKTVNDEYDGPNRDETNNLKDFFETYDSGKPTR